MTFFVSPVKRVKYFWLVVKLANGGVAITLIGVFGLNTDLTRKVNFFWLVAFYGSAMLVW